VLKITKGARTGCCASSICSSNGAPPPETSSAFHEGTLHPALIRVGHAVLDPWRLTDQNKIDAVAQIPCDAHSIFQSPVILVPDRFRFFRNNRGWSDRDRRVRPNGS
jgi:hypothetical protein